MGSVVETDGMMTVRGCPTRYTMLEYRDKVVVVVQSVESGRNTQ